MHAAGEPEGFVWKKEVDILDKWDYIEMRLVSDNEKSNAMG